MGTPAARASRRNTGNPSVNDDITARSRFGKNVPTSARKPASTKCHCNPPCRYRRSISPLSGPSPNARRQRRVYPGHAHCGLDKNAITFLRAKPSCRPRENVQHGGRANPPAIPRAARVLARGMHRRQSNFGSRQFSARQSRRHELSRPALFRRIRPVHPAHHQPIERFIQSYFPRRRSSRGQWIQQECPTALLPTNRPGRVCSRCNIADPLAGGAIRRQLL